MQDDAAAARELAKARVELAITELSDCGGPAWKQKMLFWARRKVADVAGRVPPVSASHWGMWER